MMPTTVPKLLLVLLAVAISGRSSGPPEGDVRGGVVNAPHAAGSASQELTSAADSVGEPSSTAEIGDLRLDLEEILVATGNQRGRWAAMVVSLDRGDTLLAVNFRDPMVPASNQKLLTTAAALHALGPDFRYNTFLLSEGERSGELLAGNLILYGTGDPTLSDRFYPSETAPMDSLAKRVVDAGIREIQGDLVVDGSYFTGPTRHPEWDPGDLNDAFAAPASAVAFNENLVTLRVEAGSAPRLPPTLHLLPIGSEIPVVNVAVTALGGTRSRVWLFRRTPMDPIGIEGEIPVGGRDVWRELPVPDPLLFAGLHLRNALEAQGVRLRGTVRVVSEPEQSALPAATTFGPSGLAPLHLVGSLTSPPLIEILAVVNKESNNFLAESVAKTLGRVMLGDGSFEGGMEAVRRFLVRDVGLAPAELTPRDGSGLSPRNRVSAGALVGVLGFLVGSPEWDAFWGTLPEAGVRRELGRMSGTAAARNLRAKTGTMEGVSALSGMVRTRSGERLLFSIIANEVPSEYRAKRAEDRLAVRLAELTRPLPPGTDPGLQRDRD